MAQAHSALKTQFDDYIRAFNSHVIADFMKFYSPQFKARLPNSPEVDINSIPIVFEAIFGFLHETLRPTYMLFGERALALEAWIEVVIHQDLEQPFPFTGKKYKKGDKFGYPLIVHYEFDDDLLIKSLRAFAEPPAEDPGQGILKEILPGY
ncbi:MAG: hypothetical protein M1817_000810 [Caeruleum heppii]|nr:MAG: hypothetical protein M1817_000810 [Caeruleum heppii]